MYSSGAGGSRGPRESQLTHIHLENVDGRCGSGVAWTACDISMLQMDVEWVQVLFESWVESWAMLIG